MRPVTQRLLRHVGVSATFEAYSALCCPVKMTIDKHEALGDHPATHRDRPCHQLLKVLLAAKGVRHSVPAFVNHLCLLIPCHHRYSFFDWERLHNIQVLLIRVQVNRHHHRRLTPGDYCSPSCPALTLKTAQSPHSQHQFLQVSSCTQT